jgi:hypothetical protein
MQAFEYRHLVPAEELKLVVTGRASSKTASKTAKSTRRSSRTSSRGSSEGTSKVAAERPAESVAKIPAGGTAQVHVVAPNSAAFAGLEFQLSEPPEGITLKQASASRDGVEVVLQSDASKVKPGLQGNLIVTAAAKKSATAGKAKTKDSSRGTPPLILPAIPFEVVAP